MAFRVTPHRAYELGQGHATRQYARGSELQQQISSGIRVTKPSDDPVAQKTILTQNAVIQSLQTQSATVKTATTTLSNAQTQIQTVKDLLTSAKTIAMQARQTTDTSEQTIYADQLSGILDSLLSAANAQSDGQYLFSGVSSTTQPFQTDANGNVNYQGNQTAAEVRIGTSLTAQTLYSGRDIFQPATAGTLVISGNTGIASSTALSTGSASTSLIVRHTQTTYAGASGIAAGSSSADKDTVIGAAGTHTLTIVDTSGTGASGTISLNGGEAVSFTSADTDLKITGPQGEVVYVNTQSIAAGFHGTVDLTADGTLSIDNGTTEVPIDFSENQTLENASAGVIQHFDTRGVTGTGTVAVDPAATNDLFQIISSLRETILNQPGYNTSEQDAALERSLSNLDSATNHVLAVMGKQSVSLQQLQTLGDQLDTLTLSAQTTLNDAQSTDYSSAILQLQEQQNLLQFTYQTLSAMNSMSLLNFID
jgi:flagellar hook-associated protein 3